MTRSFLVIAAEQMSMRSVAVEGPVVDFVVFSQHAYLLLTGINQRPIRLSILNPSGRDEAAKAVDAELLQRRQHSVRRAIFMPFERPLPKLARWRR
jgi:hypothetical protein